MKPNRNRLFYRISLFLLLSLAVGNMVCRCHGISEAWAQESIEGQSSTCHSHHDHHEDDAHPVDSPGDCDCEGTCCSIFLTPQKSLDLASSIVCHEVCDFLVPHNFTYFVPCPSYHPLAWNWDCASNLSKPSLYIGNASLLI